MNPHRPLLADLNGDGKVNIQDLFLVARAFSSTPGDPNWNATADVNKDDAVNIEDIFKIARDYGKTV
jgi:endoglucanase